MNVDARCEVIKRFRRLESPAAERVDRVRS
jgi:hypothetical protein